MPTWNELFRQAEHQWDDPHRTVVEFGAQLRDTGASSVLDLGCGAGRHTLYLAQLGLHVVGADIAETGISVTRRRLADGNLSAGLLICDSPVIPLASASMDSVLSLYVIYHHLLADVQRTVDEIDRVLRPGGLLLISLISTRGHRYGDGEEIEPDTFLPTTGPDAGVPHHFFDEAGVRSLMRSFDLRSLYLDERDEVGESGRTLRHSHWVCVAEKVCRP